MSAIELKPFYNEAQVAVGDDLTLRLVIDFGVVDRLEGLLGIPLDDAIDKINSSAAMMGKFLWAMTRPHHGDLSLDQIAGLLFNKEHGPAIVVTLGNLVRSTFNIGEPEGKDDKNPRKRSGGASRGSSRNGSPRASVRRTSGRKRRAAS
jgi:hypothetical protein